MPVDKVLLCQCVLFLGVNYSGSVLCKGKFEHEEGKNEYNGFSHG